MFRAPPVPHDRSQMPLPNHVADCRCDVIKPYLGVETCDPMSYDRLSFGFGNKCHDFKPTSDDVGGEMFELKFDHSSHEEESHHP